MKYATDEKLNPVDYEKKKTKKKKQKCVEVNKKKMK